jgi:hypothetical protein
VRDTGTAVDSLDELKKKQQKVGGKSKHGGMGC